MFVKAHANHKRRRRERDHGVVVRCRRLPGSIEEEHVSHSSPLEECVHTCPSIGTLGICCTLKLSLSHLTFYTNKRVIKRNVKARVIDQRRKHPPKSIEREK